MHIFQIESIDYILLSSFELKTVLLISLVKTLCFSLLNLCFASNISLFFYELFFIFFIFFYVVYFTIKMSCFKQFFKILKSFLFMKYFFYFFSFSSLLLSFKYLFALNAKNSLMKLLNHCAIFP